MAPRSMVFSATDRTQPLRQARPPPVAGGIHRNSLPRQLLEAQVIDRLGKEHQAQAGACVERDGARVPLT